MRDLTVREYKPRSLLELPETVVERARYPVIDAHNHLFGDAAAESMLPEMDACGVAVFVNVTGNVSMPFDEKGYTIRRRPLADYLASHVRPHPTRFAALTMSDFARWDDFTLFRTPENPGGDPTRWVDLCVQHLEEDARQGALGLKVTKELGLRFQGNDGAMLAVDDERLSPIWRRAGELGLPVLIHVSDPIGFFLPADETNEHYTTLQEFPGWSFQGSRYSKEELIGQRDRLVAAHPGTRFICAHVANYPEGLARVSRLLDACPNVSIDFSARIDELGRQPYAARDFFIRYRDRILFGIDMPVRSDIYRAYFRFLETRDECFEYPDYIGRWGHCRWRISGLHLPEPVLKRVYHENALRVVKGLEAVFKR
jgi:predicted TIM-barrel fold metal-dependent hydrolase